MGYVLGRRSNPSPGGQYEFSADSSNGREIGYYIAMRKVILQTEPKSFAFPFCQSNRHIQNFLRPLGINYPYDQFITYIGG
jgi:hypothetical protein